MTDTLIARLRDGNLFADRVEAADRIEALQTYNDKLIEEGSNNLGLAKERNKLLRELDTTKERLSLFLQENKHLQADVYRLEHTNAKLRAEVEMLRPMEQTINGLSSALREADSECSQLRARLTALEGQKPEFWWRPFDDGSYLGPLHDDSIEEVRKLSQEWKPLFLAAGAAPTFPFVPWSKEAEMRESWVAPQQAEPKEPNAKLAEYEDKRIADSLSQPDVSQILEQLANEPPISGNHMARTRVLLAADMYKKDQKTNTSQERVQKGEKSMQITDEQGRPIRYWGGKV